MEKEKRNTIYFERIGFFTNFFGKILFLFFVVLGFSGPLIDLFDPPSYPEPGMKVLGILGLACILGIPFFWWKWGGTITIDDKFLTVKSGFKTHLFAFDSIRGCLAVRMYFFRSGSKSYYPIDATPNAIKYTREGFYFPIKGPMLSVNGFFLWQRGVLLWSDQHENRMFIYSTRPKELCDVLSVHIK